MPTPTGVTGNVLSRFNQTLVARSPDGTLWQLAQNIADTNAFAARLSYSKDNGATWTTITPTTLQGVTDASMRIDPDGHLHIVFSHQQGPGGTSGRVNGNQYYLRGVPNGSNTSFTFTGQFLIAGGGINGSLGDLDVVAFRVPGSSPTTWEAWVIGSLYLAGSGETYAYVERINIANNGTLTAGAEGTGGTAVLNGIRFDAYTGQFSLKPRIEFHHTGDSATVQGGTPHLYISWAVGGANGFRTRKGTRSGATVAWGASVNIDTTHNLNGAGSWFDYQFDGIRCFFTGYLFTGSVYDVLLHDRDAADTTTTSRTLLANATTTDALFGGNSSFDDVGNVYLFGRDATGANGTRKLNWRRWTRATATLGTINTVDATAPDSPSVSTKRGYLPGRSVEIVYQDTGSPSPVTYDRSYVVNSAPNAPSLLSPVGNATFDRALTQRFSWTFSDPDAGDTQSKYDLRYRIVGAPTFTDTTGQTTSTFRDFPGATFAAGSYEWQVRTYDAAGVVGSYSGSEFFTAANAPAGVTITDPTNGATIAASSYLVQWSVPAQDAYQVRTVADLAGAADTSVVYTDTGVVEDPAGRSRLVAFATNNRMEHVQVRVRSMGLFTPWADARVLISFTPPATPTVVASADSPTASITVAVVNPIPGTGQPTVASVDLYRRETLTGGPGIRLAAGLTPSATYVDRTPASAVDYQYRALATAGNGTTAFSDWTG